MNGNLLIKSVQNQSLEGFVAALPDLIGCDRWEQRQSSNYVGEKYFRRIILGLEIIVTLADDSRFPDYQYSLWLQPTGPRTKDVTFIYGLSDFVARQFAAKGYDVLRPTDNSNIPSGTHYRLNLTGGNVPRDRVVTAEI